MTASNMLKLLHISVKEIAQPEKILKIPGLLYSAIRCCLGYREQKPIQTKTLLVDALLLISRNSFENHSDAVVN